MKVDARRYKKLNTHEYTNGAVCYWMNRDQRVYDNWALLLAQEFAVQNKVPLVVMFNLDPGFLGGGYRQHAFKVKNLEKVAQTLKSKNIPFYLVQGSDTEKDIVQFVKKQSIGLLVTDIFPLRLPRQWIDYIRNKVSIPMYGVDAHNIIPVWETSEKQEYAARTIRPKIYKKIDEFLTDIPSPKKHPYTWSGDVYSVEWNKILENKKIDSSINEVNWITPGERAGKISLRSFIEDDLYGYAERRNDPTVDGQSNLSPYLHFGQLSAQRIAYEIAQHSDTKITLILDKRRNGSNDGTDESAFLEELIVRSELADNYCFYNKQYDHVSGFPDWAQKTLKKHKDDEREYVYTKEAFENAKTHDPIWNAAQMEMVRKGKMHGYMRMYWAKKILQWTNTPQFAMEVAMYLNDKYELDGRDPNGYAGIAWSIGGVHDRPWFDRAIFGTVRYMAESGLRKKFNVDAYVDYVNNL